MAIGLQGEGSLFRLLLLSRSLSLSALYNCRGFSGSSFYLPEAQWTQMIPRQPSPQLTPLFRERHMCVCVCVCISVCVCVYLCVKGLYVCVRSEEHTSELQ